jgi:hypothetical protein
MEPLQLRFRPSGAGRWLEGAFLTVWLLAWAAAELIALALLAGGIRAWLLGRPLPGHSASPLVVVPVAAFLLVWLVLWTAGGWSALQQWLLCFWAEDRLTLTLNELHSCRRLGPWQRSRTLPRGAILSVEQERRGSGGSGALIVRLAERELELTRLGTPEQRQRAADLLQQALGSDDLERHPPPPIEPMLPAGWECEQRSFDSALLVPAGRLRRRQALAATLLALLLNTGLVLLLRQLRTRQDLLPLVLVLAVIAATASWGALKLALGRQEWRLDGGQLVAQRRFAGRVTVLYEARALELRQASDGDLWYGLHATDLSPVGGRRLPPGGPEPLCRSLRDASEPRALGFWLSRRCHIAFNADLPSPAEEEARRQQELDRLRQQLRRSGGFGRWLVARVDRLK